MFLANENTTCCFCGKAISIGDPVAWNRKSNGQKFHPACNPRVRYITIPSPAPVPEPTPIATPAPIALMADESYTLPEFKKLKDNAYWWEVLAQCTRVLDRILLVGPPSSGKSTTATKTLGIKHRVTMTQNTSREDLCGMFHLIDGQTQWIDGPVTKAMRSGAPILIDEIDRCGPEVESLMYSVIDDHPHLTLPNGELVNAAKGFKVLMTSNVTPDCLEAAVVDRMAAIIFAYVPHEDALQGLSEPESQIVVNYYRTIQQPRLTLNPTVRRMRAFKALYSANIPAEIAARVVFGQVAAPELLSVIANLTSEKK